MHGPVSAAYTCTLGVGCRIEFDGTGLHPDNEIQIGQSCQAAGVLGIDFPVKGQSHAASWPVFAGPSEKLVYEFKPQEIVNTLIHLTDPAQNEHFRDRYLNGVDLDLSRAIFVFSYNDASRVSPVLLDRLRRVRFGAPSLDEKVRIAREHLMPRVARQHGLEGGFPPLADELLRHLIETYAGVEG